jgi:hypothetical protein
MATPRISSLLPKPALAAVLFAAVLMVAACGQSVGVAPPNGGDGKNTESQPAFSQFPDLPLPVKGEFDMDQTMVFGGGDSWFGRLAVLTSHSANNMFDFFKQQMPNFGWQEVTSVRSAISVLTYSRQGRVATIQIQDRTIRGSESLITVSPHGAQQAPADGTVAPSPVQTIQ